MKTRQLTTTVTTIAAAAAIGLALAPTAGAAMPGSGSASDTVTWLHDQGYHVQVNGRPNGSLSQCVATGVHGLRDSNIDDHGRKRDPSAFTTVYVDISCNNTV
jgi:hypothetical protein